MGNKLIMADLIDFDSAKKEKKEREIKNRFEKAIIFRKPAMSENS